ncbi:MAG: sugar porter family MFS transporter [Planctomycetota bacterium]
MGPNRYAWKIGVFASLGGLLFGYDWVVIAGAKPLLGAYFGISGPGQAWVSGWVISSAILGCLGGATASVFLADWIGRKPTLQISASLFLVSAIASAAADSISFLVISRIAGGFAIGLASCTSPLYISEIAPKVIRGKLVATYQLAIVAGILLAQVINLVIFQWSPLPDSVTVADIAQSWSGQFGWRWMLGAESIPATCFVALSCFIPESPRWLVRRQQMEPALTTLRRIEGDNAERIIKEIEQRTQQHVASDTVSVGRSLIVRRDYRRLLLIGIVLAVFQQWCGINVIFNFADEILSQAGFPLSDVMFGIVLTGVVNLTFTVVALQAIDRWGRRPMMLLGAIGLFACFACLGASLQFDLPGPLTVICLLAAISIYAMTLAPVTWVLLSELYPVSARGTMMSISVSALWLACFVLTITFKPFIAGMGAATTFWLYSLICFVGALFVYVQVPETRGKSLEHIEAELVD